MTHNVPIGSIISIALFSSSETPYCSVVSTAVYKGIKKKDITFTRTFPIANTTVFDSNVTYLLLFPIDKLPFPFSN